MNEIDVISQKLKKAYPLSWKIFEDSCKYSIEHNLDFIKGILLASEKEVPYEQFGSFSEQLQKYLGSLGYMNVMIHQNENFALENSYARGIVFVIFLSQAAISAYLKERERYEVDLRINRNEAKRPIYDKIRYLQIYK